MPKTLDLKNNFRRLDHFHVYRQFNSEANYLSLALGKSPGCLDFEEFLEDDMM
jgi:hypothetical protein